jgi:hypothetical protein
MAAAVLLPSVQHIEGHALNWGQLACAASRGLSGRSSPDRADGIIIADQSSQCNVQCATGAQENKDKQRGKVDNEVKMQRIASLATAKNDLDRQDQERRCT